MIKKFLTSLFVVGFGATGLVLMAPTTVNAADCKMGADTSFFSFPTWYRGLEGQDDGNGGCKFNLKDKQPGPFVFTIALNVIDMALRVVGILAVGFVIYGGFRYVTSQGEPENTKKAQDTILKAVIGAVIAMISAVVVSFIVGRLG